MTQTEKRLLNLADLVIEYLTAEKPIVRQALDNMLHVDAMAIHMEFQEKVKTDGRKNPAKKKDTQPELNLK